MTYSNDFTPDEAAALAQAGDYSNPHYTETPEETARRWEEPSARTFTAAQAPPRWM